MFYCYLPLLDVRLFAVQAGELLQFPVSMPRPDSLGRGWEFIEESQMFW